MSVEGHFGEGFLHARHALDTDFALAQLNITCVGLQHMGGDTDQLLLELLRCTDNRAGEHNGEPTAAGSGAVKAVIAVAVGDNDVLGIDLELFREDLGRDCLWAVAPERGLQCDVDFSRRVHL